MLRTFSFVHLAVIFAYVVRADGGTGADSSDDGVVDFQTPMDMLLQRQRQRR